MGNCVKLAQDRKREQQKGAPAPAERTSNKRSYKQLRAEDRPVVASGLDEGGAAGMLVETPPGIMPESNVTAAELGTARTALAQQQAQLVHGLMPLSGDARPAPGLPTPGLPMGMPMMRMPPNPQVLAAIAQAQLAQLPLQAAHAVATSETPLPPVRDAAGPEAAARLGRRLALPSYEG